MLVNTTVRLFPPESGGQDRITEQLMFLPEDDNPALKTILVWNGLSSWAGAAPGTAEFVKQNCPVASCTITENRGQAESADMILFNHYSPPHHHRDTKQIWMIYMLGKTINMLCKNIYI